MVDFILHNEKRRAALDEDHAKVERKRDTAQAKVGLFIEEAMRVGVHHPPILRVEKEVQS
jgi:hypothetical protein